MSYFQISSGSGPVECELAVARFLAWLIERCPDLEIVQTTEGYEKNTLKSACIKTGEDLSGFVGTIRWICKSPYRPNHKRKNWFINFRQFQEEDPPGFDPSLIVFQTMRSGGHGGQNVNKVETAVRAIWTPTGYSTVCQEERSQLMNKKRAVERIKIHLLDEAMTAEANSRREKWTQHNTLERGDAIASFQGEKFQKI